MAKRGRGDEREWCECSVCGGDFVSYQLWYSHNLRRREKQSRSRPPDDGAQSSDSSSVTDESKTEPVAIDTSTDEVEYAGDDLNEDVASGSMSPERGPEPPPSTLLVIPSISVASKVIETSSHAAAPKTPDELALELTLNILAKKARYEESQASVVETLAILKKSEAVSPDVRSLLPSTFKQAKKRVRDCQLEVVRIDCCVNVCTLFFGANSWRSFCPECGEARYKPDSTRPRKT